MIGHYNVIPYLTIVMKRYGFNIILYDGAYFRRIELPVLNISE